jgi:hypothetical protein
VCVFVYVFVCMRVHEGVIAFCVYAHVFIHNIHIMRNVRTYMLCMHVCVCIYVHVCICVQIAIAAHVRAHQNKHVEEALSMSDF